MELTTSRIDSRPISGTMIGVCGAMPEKTRQLWVAIMRLRLGGNDWYSSAFAASREPLMMPPMHYALLIAGAGPSGSFAAELLAKGGAKVALFDGRPEGEPKPC